MYDLENEVFGLESNWEQGSWDNYINLHRPAGQTNWFHVEHYTSKDVISFNRNGIEWGLSLPT